MQQVIITRNIGQNRDQLNSVQFLLSKCHPSTKTKVEHIPSNKLGVYKYRVSFSDSKGERLSSERFSEEMQELAKLAVHIRWGGKNWTISHDEKIVPTKTTHVVNEISSLDEVAESKLPLLKELLVDNDKLQDTFSDVYNRESQIRVLLSSVVSFLESGGERRNHALLYGFPACAKTQILLRLAEILGPDSFVKLDATSTTSAGIYKLFLKELKVVPPFVIMEEIEKTHEDALRVWLGALDDRGELRKVNAREMGTKEVRILCLATANDKQLFDKMLGGSISKPGALSSRFVNQIYCPRPDEKILRMILERDINRCGGSLDWVEPIMKLTKELDINDPRKVLSFIDGGSRLLDGSYQKDIKAVYNKDELNFLLKGI